MVIVICSPNTALLASGKFVPMKISHIMVKETQQSACTHLLCFLPARKSLVQEVWICPPSQLRKKKWDS